MKKHIYCKHAYTCVAVKKEKAHFVKPIHDVDVMEQEDARFETTVTAKPQPTVEWFVQLD